MLLSLRWRRPHAAILSGLSGIIQGEIEYSDKDESRKEDAIRMMVLLLPDR